MYSRPFSAIRRMTCSLTFGLFTRDTRALDRHRRVHRLRQLAMVHSQRPQTGRRRCNSGQTIGIDLGKTVFHLVGLDLRGEVAVRKKFSRTQLLRFTANIHVELIGMEACGGSHFPVSRQSASWPL